MRIVLVNKETQLDLHGFCEYIYEKCYHAAKIVCSRVDLQNIQTFIEETIPINLDIWQIYLEIFNNLTTKVIGDDYVIEIDENKKVPNTPYTYLMFAKLINYGGTMVNGTNKIDETFKYVTDNLETYFNDYIRSRT